MGQKPQRRLRTGMSVLLNSFVELQLCTVVYCEAACGSFSILAFTILSVTKC